MDNDERYKGSEPVEEATMQLHKAVEDQTDSTIYTSAFIYIVERKNKAQLCVQINAAEEAKDDPEYYALLLSMFTRWIHDECKRRFGNV